MPAIPRWRWTPPVSSFEKAVVPPSVDPDEGELTTVCFSLEWLPYVLGALSQLTQRSAWVGTDDEISDAIALSSALMVLFDQPVCPSEETAPTPYWDEESGDDADDELPAAEQPWYGNIVIIDDNLTFIDNLGIWLIAGFIAYAGQPGAAIAFVPFARKFVLTFQKFSLGGLVRILADAVELITVDTYSATDEAVDVIVVMPEAVGFRAEDVSPVLWIELTGEANPAVEGDPAMRVVRRRLSETDVTPASVRYTGDPPVFQTTPDEGTTWNNDPTGDPRYNPSYILPRLTPYSGVECDVAARMTAELKDTLDIFIATGDAAQFATGVVGLIVLPLGIVGWLIDILLFVANTLIDIGQANIEAAFTSDVYDGIKCILNCFVNDDGTISQGRLDSAYEEIKAAYPGTVANVIDELRFIYGDVPMSNAGISRDETGDCSGCDDCVSCHEWVDAGGTAVDSTYTYRTFQSTLTPTVAFRKMVIDWQLNPNSGATLHDADLRIWLSGSGLPVYTQPISDLTGEFVVDFEPPSTENAFIIQVRSYFVGGSNYPDLPLVHFEYNPNPSISWAGGTDC